MLDFSLPCPSGSNEVGLPESTLSGARLWILGKASLVYDSGYDCQGRESITMRGAGVDDTPPSGAGCTHWHCARGDGAKCFPDQPARIHFSVFLN